MDTASLLRPRRVPTAPAPGSTDQEVGDHRLATVRAGGLGLVEAERVEPATEQQPIEVPRSLADSRCTYSTDSRPGTAWPVAMP